MAAFSQFTHFGVNRASRNPGDKTPALCWVEVSPSKLRRLSANQVFTCYKIYPSVVVENTEIINMNRSFGEGLMTLPQ